MNLFIFTFAYAAPLHPNRWGTEETINDLLLEKGETLVKIATLKSDIAAFSVGFIEEKIEKCRKELILELKK